MSSQVEGGIRLEFANPELLRAYILDPSRTRRPSPNLAERMLGQHQVSLGQFPLDRQLFKSADFTLIVEPDRDPRGLRPTALIRTDFNLGEADLSLSRYQKIKAAGLTEVTRDGLSVTDTEYFSSLAERFNPSTPVPENELFLYHWERGTGRINHPQFRERGLDTSPLTLVQTWDPDIGYGRVPVSLLSHGRYYSQQMERERLIKEEIASGWETNRDDLYRWRFLQPVGIDVYDEQKFIEALRFFESTLPRVLAAFYQSEGLAIPNINLFIEPPIIFREPEQITFESVGGQTEAVQRLRAKAALEQIEFIGEGRAILLEGPPGNGKTTLSQAFSSELGVPLVRKTTLDLNSSGQQSLVNIFESWFLEAKSVARRSGGKAVLSLEGIEAFLGLVGPDIRQQDFFINLMDRWSQDPEVVVVATSNSSETDYPPRILPAIRSRFDVIPVPPPNKKGIREILQIHMQNIYQSLGRNLFEQVDLEKLAGVIQQRVKQPSGRYLVKFLSGVFSLNQLASRQAGKLVPLDTQFAIDLVPDQRLGFRA